MEEKDVELSIRFKQFVLEKGDADFAAILDEAVNAVKARISDARARFAVAKAAELEGIPTLEQKGVEIGISIKF